MKTKKEICEYKGYKIVLLLKDELNNLFTFKIFNQNDRLIEKMFGATDKNTAKKIAKEYINNNLEKNNENKIVIEGNVYGYEDFINKISNNIKQEINKVEVNLNDEVEVELTERGKARYIEFYRDYSCHEFMQTPDTKHKTQLWKLFQIYGDEMYNADIDNVFKNNKITILK